jgi:hypothetical protein
MVTQVIKNHSECLISTRKCVLLALQFGREILTLLNPARRCPDFYFKARALSTTM